MVPSKTGRLVKKSRKEGEAERVEKEEDRVKAEEARSEQEGGRGRNELLGEGWELERIREDEVRGQEVRLAVESIKGVAGRVKTFWNTRNTEINERINSVDDILDVAYTAHAQGVQNERERVSNENGRASAEIVRELTRRRVVAAANRSKTAEAARTTAETFRVSTESTRITAEDGRKQEEESRKKGEESREKEEGKRTEAEKSRVGQVDGLIKREGVVQDLIKAAEQAAKDIEGKVATAAEEMGKLGKAEKELKDMIDTKQIQAQASRSFC